jgi:L-threonylcarbamoyladenylate synthase
MTARVRADDDAGIADAIEVLRAGGVVGLPTDTVYGIGVALDAPRGIERLFEAKNRPPDKAIMLLLADAEQATDVAEFGPAARVLAAAGWPGGLTLVLPQRPGAGLPAILTAGTPTIGLRVPDHPTPRALAAAVGPLPVTSANRSGQPTATTADAILADLGDALDLILDGGPGRGERPSTVIDCSGDLPRLLRDGAIPAAALGAVLDEAELPHELPRI